MTTYEQIEALVQRGVTHALTLWPEWQWPIRDLPTTPKRLECRSWSAPPWVLRRPVALHWGRHIGGRPGDVARLQGCRAVLAGARRAGWRRARALGPFAAELERGDERVTFDAAALETSGIGLIVEFREVLAPRASSREPWYVPGTFAWRFEVLERLPLIGCGGSRGLWPLRSLLGEDVGPTTSSGAWGRRDPGARYL